MAKSQKIIAAVSDKFTLDLLTLEQATSHGKTVVLSPLSVSLALGLTMNGSRGRARQATASALGFGIGRSLRGMNESYSDLRQAIDQTTDVDLEVANSLVGPSGITFKKHFLDKSQQFFDARIRLVDYDDPASV